MKLLEYGLIFLVVIGLAACSQAAPPIVMPTPMPTYSAEQRTEPSMITVMKDNQLVGYIIQIPIINSFGSFMGFEKPIPIVDTNGDGVVSFEELNTALAQLSADARVIEKSHPSVATRLEAEITSARSAIDQKKVANAYQDVKQIQLDLDYIKQSVK